jgi:tRNA A37 threonylcarbamoyladenosine dehydratase
MPTPDGRMLLATAVVVASALSAWAWRRRSRLGRIRACPAGDARDQPLVVVVGLGGVGSHTAHLLLRSGVRRLRLIDFDQVTLSSLNRHATASRLDVGTPKATALCAALLAIDGSADIDARVCLFCAEAAADLLCGEPALVVDAIDDIKTKAELQIHCVRAGIPVLSALGAGGKADCTRLLVAPLADVLGDPVAGGLFKYLKAAAEPGGEWWDAIEHRLECVYSSEKQRVGLLPMPDGAAASDLGSQPTFRARVLPVLPPVPAAFGAALASRALDLLPGGGVHLPSASLPTMTDNYQRRLHVQFENEIVLGRGKRDKAARKAARDGCREGGGSGGLGAGQGRVAEAQAGRGEKGSAVPLVEEEALAIPLGKEGSAVPLGEEGSAVTSEGSAPAGRNERLAVPLVLLPPGIRDGWPEMSTWPISFDETGILINEVFRGRRVRPGPTLFSLPLHSLPQDALTSLTTFSLPGLLLPQRTSPATSPPLHPPTHPTFIHSRPCAPPAHPNTYPCPPVPPASRRSRPASPTSFFPF